MEPILLIMAAGLGSRYGGDKQIDPLTSNGDIIMDFSLYDAYKAGFKRAVLVIRHDFEDEIKSHMQTRAEKFMEISYAFQELSDIPEGFIVPESRKKAWGTSHAIFAARHFIDAPFAVINADDYYGKKAFTKIYSFLTNKASASHHCMVGFQINNTLSKNGPVSRGLCQSENEILTHIEEHKNVQLNSDGIITATNASGETVTISNDTTVSMNFWGFGAEFMDIIGKMLPDALSKIIKTNPLDGEFYLPECVDAQIKSGESSFEMLTTSDKWYGVTYKEDKPEAADIFEKMLKSGEYPNFQKI